MRPSSFPGWGRVGGGEGGNGVGESNGGKWGNRKILEVMFLLTKISIWLEGRWLVVNTSTREHPGD